MEVSIIAVGIILKGIKCDLLNKKKIRGY